MFQLKWIWENLKGFRRKYIAAITISMLVQIMYIIIPIFSKTIVDTFIYSEDALDNLTNKRNLLITLCACMIIFTGIRAIIQYTSNISIEKCSQGMLLKIRKYIFANVQHQDMSFYDKNTTGDLMTRLSGDLDMVRHTVAWVIKTFFDSMVLFLTTVIYFFILDWKMALWLVSLTPLIFIISFIFKNKVGPKYVDLRDKLAGLNTVAEENISGNRVVRAFAREDHEIEVFGKKNADYASANKDAALTWLAFFPYIELTAQGLAVVQLVVGGIFVINGSLTMGEFVAIGGLIWTLSNPMRMVGNLVNDFQRFMASAAKIIEVYYSRPIIISRPDAIGKTDDFKGEVEFKNVTFGFGDNIVLDDISFKINAGETVVIMGETGSGKTSIVNLIPRFYDVYSGEVLVGGVNVRKLKLPELRESVGVAMQDVILWSDSIEGNIAFYNSDMPMEDVIYFAKLADAHNFVEKLEDGYDTIVGERGVGLSGGQKQRISLARALAMRPKILILDDTTSAVDLETERVIKSNLQNLDFDCTKLIIAQRISTAKNADNIIVLKNGKIFEQGTHEELLKNENGYYREIYELQNGDYSDIKEAIANG